MSKSLDDLIAETETTDPRAHAVFMIEKGEGRKRPSRAYVRTVEKQYGIALPNARAYVRDHAPDDADSGDEAAGFAPDVVEAIRAMDRDDASIWTNGKPKATYLKDVLGRPVSSAERDAAWDEVNAG